MMNEWKKIWMEAFVAELKYVAHPQSKFTTRPTASKPYIAWSDYAYVMEQWRSMVHALTEFPAFPQ
jgi:hypothetical protein